MAQQLRKFLPPLLLKNLFQKIGGQDQIARKEEKTRKEFKSVNFMAQQFRTLQKMEATS